LPSKIIRYHDFKPTLTNYLNIKLPIMKKLRISLVFFVAVVAALTLNLTSCGGDSNDEPSSSTDGANFQIKFTFSTDILEFADINISYMDPSGNVKTETVGSTGIWTKTLTASSLPAQALYKISINRNSKALTKTSYDVTYSCYTLIQATSGGSEAKKKEDTNTVSGKGLAAANIDTWLQFRTSSLYTGFGFKVSKSGSSYSIESVNVSF
jgi:hypothetical protein